MENPIKRKLKTLAKGVKSAVSSFSGIGKPSNINKGKPIMKLEKTFTVVKAKKPNTSKLKK